MVKDRIRWKRWLIELCGILAGSLILAAAMNMFLIPNKLAAGGIGGLGVILFHLFQIPVGATILVANIPLFIVAYFLIGSRVILQSLFGALFFSAAVEISQPYLPVVTRDILLASVYGGVIMGLGLGMVFRFRGSTGGTALLSLILSRITGLTAGQGLLGSDLLIIGLAIFVFGGEAAMYAALSLFISSWVIDAVQEGLSPVKAALIITARGKPIIDRLTRDLDRGVTRIEGKGGYTGEGREVLLCVVTRHQISNLKQIIHEEDRQAFVIIGNASEVYGEGFRRDSH